MSPKTTKYSAAAIGLRSGRRSDQWGSAVNTRRPLQHAIDYKKLSYCWETVRRESMPRIAEMDVEMTT